MIVVSPAYLSKVERGEVPPPVEEKVRSIAEVLDCDPDQLLALADRVASDLTDIIKSHPRELAVLLRSSNEIGWSEFKKRVEHAFRMNLDREATPTETLSHLLNSKWEPSAARHKRNSVNSRRL